jgi:putative membrane protein
MSFFIRLLINAAALYAATRLVDGIHFSGTPVQLLGVALVFAVVNTLIKPVLKFLSFPILLLTLWLFIFVINAMMLLLTSALSETLGLGFRVNGFVPAFVGALVVSVVAMALNALLSNTNES